MKSLAKKIVLGTIGVAVVTALGIGVQKAVATDVNHETVLTGTVVSVIPVGTTVKEGDTLVTVKTLAGPMAAARATVSGVVTAVNVESGSQVSRGQNVVTINMK